VISYFKDFLFFDNFIKRINYIYDKIREELLNYKDKDLFLAHKFENDKKIYDFKPLNELLWADNKFYYEKFKDSVWFLSCSALKDKVVPLSKCVEDPEIKETEKEKLIKAREPDLQGYTKWKEIVEKKYNKKVSIYEVKEPLEYILYLEFNDINKSVSVKEQHYIQQSESEIKCYVEIYDTGLVSSCLEDYIDKKMCKCLSKIGTLNDNDRISEELQKLNIGLYMNTDEYKCTSCILYDEDGLCNSNFIDRSVVSEDDSIVTNPFFYPPDGFGCVHFRQKGEEGKDGG